MGLPWDWVLLGVPELFGDCVPAPELSCGVLGEFEGWLPVPELS